MKGLYLTSSVLDLKNDGASRKIYEQKYFLKKNSSSCDLLFRSNEHLLLEDNEICEYKYFLWTHLNIFNKIIKKISFKNYDYIYIRYFGSSFYFIRFLKKIKKLNISIKILIEIPTYPYDKEKRSLKSKLFLIIDKYYREKLKNYVDYIVTFSEDKEIFGIPCINISNGINMDKIKIISRDKENQKIHFTSVSNCENWHGIDRFLNSLEFYYEKGGKESIFFNIVGEGRETSKLKKIVSESKYLGNIVKFFGFKNGEELDTIYNTTDIAVGCLGNHRKDIYTIQALKNKEYMAKGLPMIFSEDDPGLRGKEFVYRATHDEQLVDIKELLNWYRRLDMSPEEIREYAKDFTWDIQMKKVIDKLRDK